MKHDADAYHEVEFALNDFVRDLEDLQAVLEQMQNAENSGAEDSEDPTGICEQVMAAAEVLVAAIQAWVPSLVPTPRALDELLQTIASWQPSEQTARAATSARPLFEQLQANTYASRTNPDEVPDLEQFIKDLRATVEAVERALS